MNATVFFHSSPFLNLSGYLTFNVNKYLIVTEILITMLIFEKNLWFLFIFFIQLIFLFVYSIQIVINRTIDT